MLLLSRGSLLGASRLSVDLMAKVMVGFMGDRKVVFAQLRVYGTDARYVRV